MHPRAHQSPRRRLLRVAVAFGVSQLPVDTLRLRQLKLGGLNAWGGLLGSYDYEQQQIGLAALNALLESEAALQSFREEVGLYEAMVQALPSIVHESSDALTQPDILLDTLNLSGAVALHPMFLHSPSDSWLWERILEQSASRYWLLLAQALALLLLALLCSALLCSPRSAHPSRSAPPAACHRQCRLRDGGSDAVGLPRSHRRREARRRDDDA